MDRGGDLLLHAATLGRRPGVTMDLPSVLAALSLGFVLGSFITWLLLRVRLRETFSALSAEALRRNNESFLHLAQSRLGEFQQSATSELEKRRHAVGELVRPIHERLARVDGKLQEVEKDRIAAVRGTAGASQGNGAVTSRRFRPRPATWSRRCARRRCADDGARFSSGAWSRWRACSTTATSRSRRHRWRGRPAAARSHRAAAGGKTVIVDAKAPLAAYLDAVEALGRRCARAPAQGPCAPGPRPHGRLGSKAYSNQFQPRPISW